MESSEGYKRKFVKGLANLKQIWRYSDSQPTEIVMALSNIILTPVALGIELGGLYVFRAIIIISGIYQLICVAKNELDCRLRASIITFGMYIACATMYLSHIGFPTPTHYGWLIFVIASFGSMNRIIREKIHRSKNG